jgi:replicative DNA helicase
MNGTQFYPRGFQIGLVAHMATDKGFFVDTQGFLSESDFDLPCCRLVYEVLYNFFTAYHGLPTFEVLAIEIERALTDKHDTISTILPPEQLDSLGLTLQTIANLTRPDPVYYKTELAGYLKSVRVAQILSKFDPSDARNADKLLKDIANVDKAITAGTTKMVPTSMWTNPQARPSSQNILSIPTGLARLDSFMSGGLRLKELGMIAAVTGVGKTTAQINFMCNAIRHGHRCLFFTLELPAVTILHRFMAISAHIHMRSFDIDFETWQPVDKLKYDTIINPEYNPYIGYEHLIEAGGRALSMADIETGIKMWQDNTQAQCGKGHECRAVYVDWLDKIDSTAFERQGRNDASILQNMTAALADIAARCNVSIWTATQGTRSAVGVPVLDPRHVAQAFHKCDALDMGVGIAPQTTDAAHEILPESAATVTKAGEIVVVPECDRILVLSTIKNRRGAGVQPFEFYQGPTLKFWDAIKNARFTEKCIQEGNVIEVLRA